MAGRTSLGYVCGGIALMAISIAVSVATADPGGENLAPVRRWPDVPALIRIIDAPLTERERAGLFDPGATPQRIAACNKLRGGWLEAVPSLIRMLSVRPVAPAAADSLEASVGSSVDELVKATADRDAWVRGTAIRLLCQVGPRALPTAEWGMKDADPMVRAMVVHGLPHLGKEGEQLWLAAMRDRDPAVRKAALCRAGGMDRFGRISTFGPFPEFERIYLSPEFTGPLLASASDPDPLVRTLAIRVLRLHRNAFPAAADVALEAAESDPEFLVQWEAKDRKVPISDRDVIGQLTDLLGHEDPAMRAEAVKLLQESQAYAYEALPRLGRMAATERDPQVREAAFVACQEILNTSFPTHLRPIVDIPPGPLAGVLFGVTLDRQIHPSVRWEVSRQVVFSRKNLSPQTLKAAIPVLFKAVADDDPMAMTSAEWLRDATAYASPSDAPTYAAALGDPSPKLRSAAVEILRRNWAVSLPAATLAMGDPDPAVRASAVNLARDLRWEAQKGRAATMQKLISLLSDSEPCVRMMAVQTLAQPMDGNGTMAAAAAIKPLLLDPDDDVAGAAAEALNTIAPPLYGLQWVGHSLTPVLPPNAPAVPTAPGVTWATTAQPAGPTFNVAVWGWGTFAATIVAVLAVGHVLARTRPSRAHLFAASIAGPEQALDDAGSLAAHLLERRRLRPDELQQPRS
jgi:HEAT repeat protein